MMVGILTNRCSLRCTQSVLAIGDKVIDKSLVLVEYALGHE